MKTKIKILLIALLSIVLCLVLTGCGEQQEVNETDANKLAEEFVKAIMELDEGEESDASGEAVEGEYVEDEDGDLKEEEGEEEEVTDPYAGTLTEVYSDDSTLIYKDEDAYMVFKHNGDEITGYSVYAEFDSEEEAKEALDEYNEDPDEDVINAYVDGNKVYLEYDKSVYEDLTLSTVKLMYTLMQDDGE